MLSKQCHGFEYPITEHISRYLVTFVGCFSCDSVDRRCSNCSSSQDPLVHRLYWKALWIHNPGTRKFRPPFSLKPSQYRLAILPSPSTVSGAYNISTRHPGLNILHSLGQGATSIILLTYYRQLKSSHNKSLCYSIVDKFIRPIRSRYICTVEKS